MLPSIVKAKKTPIAEKKRCRLWRRSRPRLKGPLRHGDKHTARSHRKRRQCLQGAAMSQSNGAKRNLRTGGKILIDQLIAQGVERVTCVPGESYLAALDAMHGSPIDVVICRAEGGAAMMAEAYGKLTGKPGICFVTRGPGATNASHGVHIAMQDSTPMILFVGQVDTGMRERETFQELDYKAVFGSMAKWVVEIDRPDRIPELVARAFRVAMQGRRGPVVVALPENMLTETAAVSDGPRVEPAITWPAPSDIDRLGAMLASAKAPIVVLGGSSWDEAASKSIAQFAERFDLPVATSFRRASLFDADHPNYAGDLGIGPNPRLKARITGADLIVLIGGRLTEMPSSSYTLLDIPSPTQQLVHVHPGAEELGQIYQPALAIQATPVAFAQAVGTLRPDVVPAWKSEPAKAHADYLRWTDTPRELPGAFQYGQVVAWLRDRLPKDAIVCNGAGNYAGWLHRHHRFHAFAAQLAPTSGSMGYGCACRRDGEAALPRPRCRRLCRRRLLPDERPGVCDRHAIWSSAHCCRHRQRPIWHYSHASGARISRPRVRNAAEEP
ncbi:acetolactate synthase-1/2/3 large subunit [Bradyrhizobium sp. USDA 4504]